MPFLHGSLSYQRFSLTGFEFEQFTDEHIETLASNTPSSFETAAVENVSVGFLGGDHLFDEEFSEPKNVINEAVHLAARVDTNDIPSAHRDAWLKIELAGIAKDNDGGGFTKLQKKEAKEAVEQRCEIEAANGKYRKMKSFPMLWDVPGEQLYFGGSLGTAGRLCIDLLEQSFGVEIRHLGAGAIARAWGVENGLYGEVDDLQPVSFIEKNAFASHVWSNENSEAPDFLGNEFLMWLWWMVDTQSDTLALEDETEVVVMLAKTLTLECPMGESGKETISAESPIHLPEAMQAIRSGKLPRKMGMTLIRDERQFDLVLQPETFSISGGKIHVEDDEEFGNEERIDAIRTLSETTDMMFQAFCAQRVSDDWKKQHQQIHRWLSVEQSSGRKAA